jgi:hypothetical protein
MIVFWYAVPCSLVEFHQRFGGAYCLHLQGDASKINYVSVVWNNLTLTDLTKLACKEIFLTKVIIVFICLKFCEIMILF